MEHWNPEISWELRMATPTVQRDERARIKQIVVEFCAKSLQIILESRIPFLGSSIHCGEGHSPRSSASSLSSTGPSAKGCWFNLDLGEFSSVLESLEPWRRGALQPMVIDVLLVRPKGMGTNRPSLAVAPSGQQIPIGHKPYGVKFPVSLSPEGHVDSSFRGPQSATVLERWVVQFLGASASLKGTSRVKGAIELPEGKRDSNSRGRPSKASGVGGSSGGSGSGLTLQKESVGVALKETKEVGKAADRVVTGGALPQLLPHAIEVPAVYKRTVIMLRSLYSRVRLLPAHHLFRLASSSSHRCNFTLSYRVSLSPPPLSECDEMDMTMYDFTPVETPYGRMCLSVAYRLTTPVTALEIAPPILPQIISDYVGSPATDHLKRFSSDWHSEPCSGPSERRGVHLDIFPASVPSSPASGCSWSQGVNKIQRTVQPPASPSSHVVKDERDGSIPLPWVENHPYGPLPVTLSRGSNKSGGHDDADDEELPCPFAVDDEPEEHGCRMDSPRLSTKASESPHSTGHWGFPYKRSQEAEVGALVRMLKSAAPLRHPNYPSRITSKLPSTSMGTSWSEAVKEISQYPTIRDMPDEIDTTAPPPVLDPTAPQPVLDPTAPQPVLGEIGYHPTKTTADALEELRVYKEIRDSLLG